MLNPLFRAQRSLVWLRPSSSARPPQPQRPAPKLELHNISGPLNRPGPSCLRVLDTLSDCPLSWAAAPHPPVCVAHTDDCPLSPPPTGEGVFRGPSLCLWCKKVLSTLLLN